jgi:hypothetical protein
VVFGLAFGVVLTIGLVLALGVTLLVGLVLGFVFKMLVLDFADDLETFVLSFFVSSSCLVQQYGHISSFFLMYFLHFIHFFFVLLFIMNSMNQSTNIKKASTKKKYKSY